MWLHTQWMRHTHVICAITAGIDDPVYSTLPSLYECVLHFGLQPEHMKENVLGKEKKKTYFHRTSLSLSLSSKFEERGKIKGECSDGLWRWRLAPPRRWRTKSLRAPLSSSPFSFFLLLLTFNPTWALFTLCFEADCKLHVLISLVTVAYTYFKHRCVFHPPVTALSLCSCLPLHLLAAVWSHMLIYEKHFHNIYEKYDFVFVFHVKKM